MRGRPRLAVLVRVLTLTLGMLPAVGGAGSPGGTAARPAGDPDERATALVRSLTRAEKVALVHSRFGMPVRGRPAPDGALGSAAFVPGVPHVGLPPLHESDAGLGVANPTNAPYDATAMPSGLALAATFDPSLAEASGDAIGLEARAMGFSVLLGGGANLIREPRGGRNFEYASEDPLLTGTIVGAAVRGVQRHGVVGTVKHLALNAQENGRVMYDAHLGEAAARESDLLAFELALEAGRPGAVMAGYNRVNGAYASENAHLITDVLKGDWRFPGWVMSDWGGTHSTAAAANAGLDQESGEENDASVFFGDALDRAVADGRIPAARLDDMVRRILRSRIVAGQLDRPAPVNPTKHVDRTTLAAHADVAQRVAEQAITLLKNDGDLLPLAAPNRLLVVGAHADFGVLSGGGSSQVMPRGSMRAEGDPPGLFYGKPKVYHPSSPLVALRDALPKTRVDHLDGRDVAAAVRQAKAADIAIVFAEQWSNESRDSDTLALPDDQDALIAAVAGSNPRTIVVLETGHAVTMPWLARVAAVVEAWYPGGRGGRAIADVLTGRVAPSGRLPISFPASETQLPRPVLPRRDQTTSNPDEPAKGGVFVVDDTIEGADIGYKWDLRRGQTPLFPFGFGLTYTRFATGNLKVAASGQTLTIEADVTNVGQRQGIDTPQFYLDGPGLPRRLVGWTRVALAPGASRHVSVTVDPRLLARFDVAAHAWHIADGDYIVSWRDHALADGAAAQIHLAERTWPARHAQP